MVRRTLTHIVNYLRPGFHPSQLRDEHLAQAVLDRYSSPLSKLIEPISRAA
jgi:predicted metal-dependent hydrolase